MARIAQVGTLNVKRSCKDRMEPKTSFEEKQREGRAVSSVSPEPARWEAELLRPSDSEHPPAKRRSGLAGAWSSWCSGGFGSYSFRKMSVNLIKEMLLVASLQNADDLCHT